MTPPPTSIHRFFFERGAPIPPGTAALPLALQIIHLHYPIGRWYLSDRLSSHPLTLHTSLLATPLIQDLEFYLEEVPDCVRHGYVTRIFSAGRRKVHATELIDYLTQHATMYSSDAILIMDTDDLFLLMQYDTSFLVINCITCMIHHETTIQGCTAHVPNKRMNVIFATIHNNYNPIS